MKKLLSLLLLLILTLTSSNLVINVSAEENQKTIIDNNVDLTKSSGYIGMLASAINYQASKLGNGVILDINWWFTSCCYPR